MLAFSVHLCVAQETHTIEPAEFEITYSIKEQPFWDIYIFRCGKKASQYFCQAKLKRNIMLANDDPAYFILSNEEMKDLNTPEYEKKYPLSTGNNDRIYRNLEQGKISTYSTVFGTHYLITEDISIPDWTIHENW